MNDHPELQRPFYNFRAPPAFAWEVAAIGINMVSMANNHALDFGGDGLRDCLKALIMGSTSPMPEQGSLWRAPEPGTTGVQSQKTKFALLSYMRYWTQKYRCTDPDAPCLATINPAEILVAKENGKVETVEGLVEKDVQAMEDDVVLAKRHNDVVIVALHNHDRSHHRAHGIQDDDAYQRRNHVPPGHRRRLPTSCWGPGPTWPEGSRFIRESRSSTACRISSTSTAPPRSFRSI